MPLDNMKRHSEICTILLLAWLLVGLAACGDRADVAPSSLRSSPDVEERAELPVKNGRIDRTHDAVVAIAGSRSICTGTLIAPNLVLTARHCVSDDSATRRRGFRCGRDSFTQTDAPGDIQYVTTDHRIVDQRGQPIRSPSLTRKVTDIAVPRNEDDVCQSDIALLTLDQSIPANEVRPVPPRLDRGVSRGETFDAIGYGLDGRQRGSSGIRRIREDQEVLEPNLRRRQYGHSGQKCSGDSGSGDINDNRQVIGVTVRAPRNCERGVSVSVYDWRTFVAERAYDAVQTGGYPAPSWIETVDQDVDGHADGNDNCPKSTNPSQRDLDGDGVGDACDLDIDGDQIVNFEDNCPETPNPEQRDEDDDGNGDACDDDADNDGVPDDGDNCPNTANPDQRNSDGGARGNACNPDDDADGVEDEADNCPQTPNPEQRDEDNDGNGDVCDDDADNDGIPDDEDNCPNTPNPDQTNTNDRGPGDACNPDDDEDGVEDEADNCPHTPNEEQSDLDEDGRGDACDSDTDGDGIEDENDNCPQTPNPAQRDANDNGRGDACEVDTDDDGVVDARDNCPETPNADQVDADGDGLGNACDPDADADTIPNEEDNCPLTPNSPQRDSDGDGRGDLCDDSSRSGSSGARPDAGTRGEASRVGSGSDTGLGSKGAEENGGGCQLAGSPAPPLPGSLLMTLLLVGGYAVRPRRESDSRS